MEVSLYRVGSAAAVGYCAGLLANANPAASATFVIITSVIHGIVTEIFGNTNSKTTNRMLVHASSAILCAAAVISYKITEKLVTAIAMEALGKVCLYSALILLASPVYTVPKYSKI